MGRLARNRYKLTIQRVARSHLSGTTIQRVARSHLSGITIQRVARSHLSGITIQRVARTHLSRITIQRVARSHLSGITIQRVARSHPFGIIIQRVAQVDIQTRRKKTLPHHGKAAAQGIREIQGPNIEIQGPQKIRINTQIRIVFAYLFVFGNTRPRIVVLQNYGPWLALEYSRSFWVN